MPCSSNVAAIEAFCGSANAPMLDRKLYITSADNITTIPAASNHVISSNMTMSGLFYEWFFSKEESSYSSEIDENGMWQTEVKIFIEKQTSAKSHILNGVNGDNYVAIVVDRNGESRLIGDTTNGCRIRVRETTTPKNGYEVTITWESPLAPYFYTGTITTS